MLSRWLALLRRVRISSSSAAQPVPLQSVISHAEWKRDAERSECECVEVTTVKYLVDVARSGQRCTTRGGRVRSFMKLNLPIAAGQAMLSCVRGSASVLAARHSVLVQG